MSPVMFGSVLLLAAAISSGTGPALPAPARVPTFRPTSGVTAQATASVRIVSGVRFGRDHILAAPPEATRRPISLTEQDGRTVPAELLEFQ
jgi:hypothetical protein